MSIQCVKQIPEQNVKTCSCCRLGELMVVAALWGGGLSCLGFSGKDGRVSCISYRGKPHESPGRFSGVAEKGACEPGAATAILSPRGGETAKPRKTELIQRKQK